MRDSDVMVNQVHTSYWKSIFRLRIKKGCHTGASSGISFCNHPLFVQFCDHVRAVIGIGNVNFIFYCSVRPAGRTE